MAGSLFSHILAHLKSKDEQRSYVSQGHSNYLLTPQKAGAFTRLSPVKRDNDCTSTSSTTITCTDSRKIRVGGMLARPTPVYMGANQVEQISAEELKDESPKFGTQSFE